MRNIRRTARHAGSHYQYGDLRNALIAAATGLAQEEGPDAVTLREVARRVDVSPAAVYRHFASHDDLLGAVKQRALAAMAKVMKAELARTPAGNDRAQAAVDRLRALGGAYLTFAFSEPGLFRLIFGRRGHPVTGQPSPEPQDDPLTMLAAALDELVAAGGLPANRRPHAEVAAWAAVHGLATLCLDGPLAATPPAGRQALADRTVDAILNGI